MSIVQLKDVSHAFAQNSSSSPKVKVLEDFNLDVGEGEFVSIFGPNGSCKSTTLNLIAGIIRPDSGIVAHSRQHEPGSIGYVFQNHEDTLLPWKTVRENLKFPLDIMRYDEDTKRKHVSTSLSEFGLVEHADKYIYQLSGGLKQLVAIARASVYRPTLMLLDEPFSALDYSISRSCWLRVREYLLHERVTIICVSHNVDEAVFLGDRVIIVSPRPGKVIEDIPVSLGRHRDLDLLASADFFEVRARVLGAFEKGLHN